MKNDPKPHQRSGVGVIRFNPSDSRMNIADVHRPRDLRTFSLSLLLLAIVGWWLYAHVIEPQPSYIYADPQIPYLMSSLSVFKGQSYTFIDHPGTPVELIGSALLTLTYPFVRDSEETFILYHVLHPQLFLIMSHALLTLGSIGTIALLALRALPIKHWTDELAAVAVSALYFAIHPKAFDSIVLWSHNSFSFPVGASLTLCLFSLLQSKMNLTWRRLTLLGLGVGVLTAVQFYFATWVVGAVVAVSAFVLLQRRGLREALLAGLNVGAASLAGFVVMTIPIINRYPEFASWIIEVITHQGRHGSGPPGFISLQLAASNFVGLWQLLPLLFIAIVLVFALVGITIVIHRRLFRPKAGLWATALGLTVQVALMTALVIKHPGVIYMQAVAATLPLLLAIAFTFLYSSRPRIKSSQRLLKLFLGSLIFIGFFFNMHRSIQLRRNVNLQVQSAVEDINALSNRFAKENERDRRSLTVLWVYGSPSDCYALWYGNRHADNAFSEEISRICPQDLELEIAQDRVSLPDGSAVPVDHVKWDIIVATETVLNGFPYIAEHGEVAYSKARLGTFGRIVYILSPLGELEQ